MKNNLNNVIVVTNSNVKNFPIKHPEKLTIIFIQPDELLELIKSNKYHNSVYLLHIPTRSLFAEYVYDQLLS